MPSPRRLVCPWCGHAGSPGEACGACGGGFDAETRRQTQNDMGPWFVRDPRRPFQPGASYETIVRRIDRGDIGPTTIMRGPTTRQLWAAARRVPAIAHVLGYCHACDGRVDPGAGHCPSCQARFGPWLERDRLGLVPVRVHPDEAPEDEDARGMLVAVAVPVPAAEGAAAVVRRDSVGRDDWPAGDAEAARFAAIAAGLERGAASSRGRTSGTWTAVIAALLIVLAGLVVLPMAPGLLASLRSGDAQDTAADLPGGAFRSPTDAPGDPERLPVAAPDASAPASAPAPAPAPAPALAPGPAPNPATGRGVARDTAVTLDLRRRQRLAQDSAADPASRLAAWRAVERGLASAQERGVAIPEGLDAATVAAGIDRVHLDAFLAGWSPAEVLAADPGPAEPDVPRRPEPPAAPSPAGESTERRPQFFEADDRD